MTQKRLRDPERMHLLLEMLRQRQDHPTAQTCFEDIRKQVPAIGRSTVYRHLAKMVKDGLIIELHIDEGPARYDANTECHAHYYCTKCMKMYDVDELYIKAKWPGELKECSFVAKGTCQNCLSQNNE